MNYKILVVDDEPANVNLLARIFSQHYDVIKAASGPEGLEMLAHHDVSLIISDQRMPDMTGVEFLQKAAELRPHCVRIILTGYTDAGSIIDAINSGVVYKYVTKPWVNADLLQTVKRGLSHFETLKAQNQLNTMNIRLRQQLDDTTAVLVRALMAVMNAADPEAGKRGAGVRDIALRIGKSISLDAAELRHLSVAAYLSEAADFYVSTAQDGETAASNGHSTRQTVLDALSEVPALDDAVSGIRYLNENYDGTGPYGLAADQIPLFSRIVSIARTYIDMGSALGIETGTSSPRETDLAGTKSSRLDELMEAIHAQAGSKFDPEIIGSFIETPVLIS